MVVMLLRFFVYVSALLVVAAALPLAHAADIPQCGRSRIGSARIVGQPDSAEGPWPFQVRLQRTDSTSRICDATLISSQWVMTASHCFNSTDASGYQVIFGGLSEIRAAVAQIVKHPQYSSSFNVNDIALIKLSQPINLSAYPDINVACLPKATDQFLSNANCYARGRGHTKDVLPSAQQSDQMQTIALSVLSHKDCSKYYTSVTDETKICSDNGLTGACFGDSGGPLMCARSGGAYVVTGVASFGTESCNQQPYPTVYSNVAAYLSWINSVTGL